MTARNAYTLEGVVQRYADRTVLCIDKLDIPTNTVFAILGPSGAGKSTLLRLLAMLESPSFGAVTLQLDNQTYDHSTITIAVRRRLAMVFQQPALLTQSVRLNVAYGLKVRRKRDRDCRVQKLLEQVQLSHLADKPAHTLSGGEKQRVAIARALVLEPDVLILDEPTANLDPFNIRIIETLLTSQTQPITVIIVTHNIFQARRLADYAALLLNGELIEVADTETFFNYPRDPRTAAFINGDMIY
jgi:tungstate transport system ATP-binding protein